MIKCGISLCKSLAEVRTEFGEYLCEMHRQTGVSFDIFAPRSIGGDLPMSRRCFRGDHTYCPKIWTSYPDDQGPCQCSCHIDD